MIAAAFDVGRSTGFTIGELDFKVVPTLLASSNLLGTDITDPTIEAWLRAQLVQLRTTHVIIELPLVEPRSNTHREMMHLRQLWQQWAHNVTEVDMAVTEVQFITPSQWKSTPAKKFPVHRMQALDKWHSHAPSKHEEDAARMLYWYSYWAWRNT